MLTVGAKLRSTQMIPGQEKQHIWDIGAVSCSCLEGSKRNLPKYVFFFFFVQQEGKYANGLDMEVALLALHCYLALLISCLFI